MNAQQPNATDRPGDVHERVAGHVGPAFRTVLESCRAAISRPVGPHQLAHFSGGILDFSLDILGRVLGDSAPPSQERGVRLGRQLSLLFDGLDDTLRGVRSGELIRLVVQTGTGVSYCDRIVPGQVVVGTRFTEDAEHTPLVALPTMNDVRSTDVVLADLVTDVRRSLRQGSQNPGGYEAEPAEDDDQPGPRAVTQAATVETFTDDEVLAAFVRAASGVVSPDDLHYVALCRDGTIMATVDQLAHDELSRYFTQISIQSRRNFYADFGRGLGFLAGRLARISVPVMAGPLHRVVLDVEQGAIYYYRLRSDVYLLGVTLDQSKVFAVDRRMAALATECAELVTRDRT